MEWLIGCTPKMLVYTNAFGGSMLSSKIISSKILDLPSLREQCSPLPREAATIRHKEIRSQTKKKERKKKVEDFFQKICTA